jgi:hypothetical protein
VDPHLQVLNTCATSESVEATKQAPTETRNLQVARLATSAGLGSRSSCPGWLPVIPTRCWIPALQSVTVDPTA